ncbi:hypothetical protein GF340_03845 [Candidatus Peregrinibacteria bacterium]|nr:hypothetical protein [Candidatus Peregrinibacteria bacterium]
MNNSFSDTLISEAHIKEELGKLLMLLNEREKIIVEERFALNDAYKKTLEEIGNSFNVTRERVRQIENSALQKLKRNLQAYSIFYGVNNEAYELLLESGGLLCEEDLLSKLIGNFKTLGASLIRLLLHIDSRFAAHGNTIKIKPYYRLVEYDEAVIKSVAESTISILKKKNELLKISEIKQELQNINKGFGSYGVATFKSIFGIHKELKLIDDKVGLIKWKHINPKTLRDKIFYVLRQHSSPMHFVEICNTIIDSRFDNKRVNLQAVHNELIRFNDFILIGRGIYALKEWGYSSGTVTDIIKGLLREHRNLNEEEIVQKVLEKRQVKPITVLLNLKSKKDFIRIGRKQYKLSEKDS